MNELNEIKEDVKEIKAIVIRLQIQQAVMDTKQKTFSWVFGAMGGVAVWMIKGFLGK